MALQKFIETTILVTSLLTAPTVVLAQDEADKLKLNATYAQVLNAQYAAETPDQMAAVIAGYNELADQGHAQAAYRLARIYRFGILADKDDAKAVEYYERSLASGRTESMGELGIALLNAGRPNDAFAAFEKADDLGISGSHEVTRAKANIRGDFGDASNQREGIAELEELWAQGDQKAGAALAQTYYYGWTGEVDHEKSLSIFEKLAEQGDTYALDRIAVFYRNGYVFERDYSQAASYYQKAVDAGREKSLFGLAEMQVRLNRGSAALASLKKASELGLEGADLEIAVGHLNGDFGKANDPKFGANALRAGIGDDKIDYKIAALELLAEGRRLSVDMPATIAAVEAAADQGNANAANALIQLTREKPGLVENAWRKRQEYLQAYSDVLSDRSRAIESVYLTLDSNRPSDVGPALSQLLAGYKDDEFRYGFQRVFWEDKNAFTFLLQEKLSQLGLFEGDINGLMTKNTVRAVLNFCRQKEIYDECIHGPLRSNAMRKIVDALVPTGA